MINNDPHSKSFFTDVIRRDNPIVSFITGIFFSTVAYPKMTLEVFIRKNFGERYFNLASAWLIAIFLMLVSFGGALLSNLFAKLFGGYSRDMDWHIFNSHFITWYLFIIGFLYFSYQREKEVKRSGNSTFDFEKFSLYSGDIDPRFEEFKIKGQKADIRQIETLLEPGLFFVIGIFLWFIGQALGVLLVVCSIFYCLGNWANHKRHDNFVLDVIDKLIIDKEAVSAYADNMQPQQTRGVRFYAKRPKNEFFRRKVAENFKSGNDDFTSDVS